MSGSTPTYRQTDLFVSAALPILADVVDVVEDEIEVHAHDFCEIAVVAGGTAEHVTAGGSRPIRLGDVFVLRPGAWHGFADCHDLVVANTCFSVATLAGDLAFLRDLPAFRQLLWSGPVAAGRHGVLERKTDSATVDAVTERVRTLNQELTDRPDNRVLLLGQLLTVLGHLVEGAAPTSETELPSAVKEIADQLESAPDRPWTMNEIAVAVSLDPAHLSRLFRRHLGLPPIAYLARIRAERAAGLLARSDLPVARVGAMVGWPDPTYFARRFKALHGVTPTVYRERSQKSLCAVPYQNS